MSVLPAVVPPGAAERGLSRRLDALADLVRIGREREGADGVSATLITDSDALLRRAGERLRLSGSHTVVALAGGTGSGKSTLFNTLSGATFSPPGVTRPTTRHVHACVWGMQGAGPLLDWLGVQRRHRYARASALDSGESALNGLLLLDLPDHDSVLASSMETVDRLTKLADMLVFVLDPQKYADASVHRRYLIPMAAHAGVITVVLNQADLLTPEQVSDCEQDLRRLLDDEGLTDAQVLPVSARTGAGLDALRGVLAGTVAAQHAASERISADIDSFLGGFAPHAGNQVAPDRAMRSLAPPSARDSGAGTAPDAGGGDGRPAGGAEGGPDFRTGLPPLSAAASALAHSGPLPRSEPGKAPWDAADWDDGQPLAAPVAVTRPPWEDALPEGTPRAGAEQDPVEFVPDEPGGALIEAFAQAAGIAAVAQAVASAREAQAIRLAGWPVARMLSRRPDPVRRLKGGDRHALPVPAAAQQSEVDNAITRLADALGAQLPAPWTRSVREAARSQAPQVPAALATAVSAGIPPRASIPGWWRLVAAWQWLLAVLAVVGIAWSVVIAVGHVLKASSALLSDLSLIPWLLIMAAAVLLLGWLTASGCHNMALAAAEREQAAAVRDMRDQVAATARDLVLAPAGGEVAEYERFRLALAAAQAPAPGGAPA
ncbi:MAG TPA: GTPase [Trebonia sp.]|jgi:GTP-binding protein EngB required for normal cell division|nr:GTPase [Trebonia sp.]